MKGIRFAIFDNEPFHVAAYRATLLDFGVPPSDIWPDEGAAKTTSWLAVGESLVRLKTAGWDPHQSVIVLLLDLALDPQDERYEDGVEKILDWQETLNHYVLVVCTKSPTTAKERLGDVPDAIFSKRKERTADRRREYLRQSIQDGLVRFRKRTGRQIALARESLASVPDSLNLRLFEATLGEFALADVTRVVVGDALLDGKPLIVMATGGYSGAFVVLYQFKATNRGTRQVAAKVSRDRGLLEDELRRLKQILAAGHKFSTVPIQPLGEVLEIPSDRPIFLLQQHYVNGKTLELALVEDPKQRSFWPVLRSTLDSLAAEGLADGVRAAFLERFHFSADSKFRLRSSLPDFRAAIDHLMLNPAFRKRFGRESLGLADVQSSVDQWEEMVSVLRIEECLAFEQHGDMNPRNIIVRQVGPQPDAWEIKFIDFARAGPWPAFYDIIRLRLQLALRLLDPQRTMRDQFSERIVLWDHVAATNQMPPTGSRGVSGHEHVAAFIELSERLQKIIDVRAPSDTKQARHTALVSRAVIVHELVKMSLYHDAPWMKRIWFFLWAVRELNALRKIAGM